MNSFNNLTSIVVPRHVYDKRAEIDIDENSFLFYGVFEQRSEVDQALLKKFGEGRICQIIPGQDRHTADFLYSRKETFSLRDRTAILKFMHNIGAASIYIDITGLPFHIWSPVVCVSLKSGLITKCIYVEPESYTYNLSPKPDEFFDLSEKIQGLSSIPMFATLNAEPPEKSILVPLLGFEGVRFSHLIETIEPSEKDVFPVIGVPGFEIDYPFHTFECNATVLRLNKSWQRVEYVDAACPFSLFSRLVELQNRDQEKHLQIAPIGTKPHALGAVMYAIKHSNVSLLYDHPIENQERTRGIGQCHLYRVSEFLNFND